MKTPDEIKKGLECCAYLGRCSEGCPYQVYVEGSFGCDELGCEDGLLPDALAYIQQLEQERIMLMNTVSKMCGKTPRWISVEERLPEPYKSVLVYVKHTPEFFSEWRVVMEDCWLGDGWDCNADTEVHEVTHWMPLPEPPVEV